MKALFDCSMPTVFPNFRESFTLFFKFVKKSSVKTTKYTGVLCHKFEHTVKLCSPVGFNVVRGVRHCLSYRLIIS